MLRAYINFETVEEVLDAYETLKNNERVEVVFLLPRFGTRSDGSLNLNDLTVLFVYMGKVLCELSIRIGKRAPTYESQHFIYSVQRSCTYPNEDVYLSNKEEARMTLH